MEPLLGSTALDRLAREDLLLAFDFDGTLAPIVDDPAQAALRPTTRRLLARAAQLYPCVVISGRTERDVQEKLSGVTIWYAVGNGFLDEPEQIDARRRVVRRWMAPLRAAIGAYPGVVIEDKGVSLAIHYRRAANAERARESIEDAARLLRRARIIPGKEALHLLPVGGVAKCAALNRVRVKVSCARALYFGDDGTDEEAFAAGPAVTGVRIGHSTSSAAEYFLHGQEEIDAALERLIALRASKQIAPERWRVAAPRGIKPSRD